MRFEDLQVWKRSARLCTEIYAIFRDSRDFGFRDQITRSALSIASNIAEGFERDSQKEKLRFLNFAKGSCGELRTQIYIGIEIGYIDRAVGRRLTDETRQISSMLQGLIQAYRRRLQGR